jgi:hypothetical protein
MKQPVFSANHNGTFNIFYRLSGASNQWSTYRIARRYCPKAYWMAEPNGPLGTYFVSCLFRQFRMASNTGFVDSFRASRKASGRGTAGMEEQPGHQRST